LKQNWKKKKKNRSVCDELGGRVEGGSNILLYIKERSPIEGNI
jgi:hypothetical protein